MANSGSSLTFQATPEVEETLPQNTASLREQIKKKIKKYMYQWHRLIGITTLIPVIFWTISGLMHPFMSHWFKPQIAHEFIKPESLDQAKIGLSLQPVLLQNQLNSFKNFRLITYNDHTFYQIKKTNNKLAYFDTQTGKELPDGDKKYAEFLARYFIDDTHSKVKSITEITDFDNEYRYVNRLLPVWKVAFDRPDQMDVYVETEQTRLANFNENKRKAFLWVFNNFHNWDFLANITTNTLRIGMMVLLLSIIILSTISGLVIYGFMWKKFKKPRNSTDSIGFLRKNHRSIGIATSFVTFTFAFSGGYHILKKLTPDTRINYLYQPVIKTTDLAIAPLALPLDWSKVSNLSLAKIDDKLYYQVFEKSTDRNAWKKQQQDKAETTTNTKSFEKEPSITYYDAQTAKILPDGVILHAKDLVARFIEQEQQGGITAACCEPTDEATGSNNTVLPTLLSAVFINKFDREYGFVNKRLPVVKLALVTSDKTTYYIEPATSRLAAKITDTDRQEGLSFAVFHKFFLMDWAGKNVRDITMMFSALGVLVVSLFGLVLFFKVK